MDDIIFDRRVLYRAPLSEWPVTLELAKQHSRIQHDTEDTLLEHYLSAAVEYCEAFVEETWPLTEYQLITQRWPRGSFALPVPPVRELRDISYYNTDGELAALTPDQYEVQSVNGSGKICIDRPSDARTNNALLFNMVAGFGSAEVPVPGGGFSYSFPVTFYSTPDASQPHEWPSLEKQAVLYLFAHQYENREPVVVGSINSEIVTTLESFLRRRRRYGL